MAIRTGPGIPLQLADLPELLTRQQLADFTGIASQTLARWVVEGRGPRLTKLGQAARYRKSDVVDWIDAGRQVGA